MVHIHMPCEMERSRRLLQLQLVQLAAVRRSVEVYNWARMFASMEWLMRDKFAEPPDGWKVKRACEDKSYKVLPDVTAPAIIFLPRTEVLRPYRCMFARATPFLTLS